MTIKDIIKLLPADVETYRRRLTAIEEDGFNKDFMKVFYRVYEVLSALSKITIPELAAEEEIYKIIYNIERKTCASEKCEKTCPAYPENREYPCGVKLRARELTKALLNKIPKPEGKELCTCKDPDYYCIICDGQMPKGKEAEYRMALEKIVKELRYFNVHTAMKANDIASKALKVT